MIFASIGVSYYLFKEKRDSLKELASKPATIESNKSIVKKNEEMLKELEKNIEKGLALDSILNEKNNTQQEIGKSVTTELSKPLPLPPIQKEIVDLEKVTDEKSIIYEESIDKKLPIKQMVFDPSKPKLAIIIDDVSYDYQMKRILEIGIPLTPSILPPTPRHPKSAKLAKMAKTYMIHLPLEATDFYSPEDKTLKVGDSIEVIDKRISEILSLYPDVKYINGHTGSKFTSDLESMRRLVNVLQKYNINYIDSRTSPYAKSDIVSRELGVFIPKRDVFIDNKRDHTYILNQLKEAVQKSKKNGFAIAIGHPHKETLDTIERNLHIFKDINVIYATDTHKHISQAID